MGTRNLTIVVLNGEYKADKYCQWDGYLEGAGLGMLDFLATKFEKTQFITNLNKLKVLTRKQVNELWVSFGKKPDESWVNMEVADKFKKVHPQLGRDMPGYEFLAAIQDGATQTIAESDIEFVNDSLFCEYAYVVDLDKDTFEIYIGYNDKPLDKTERFYQEKPNDGGYYPVKLLKSYDLNNLPTKEDLLELDKELQETG